MEKVNVQRKEDLNIPVKEINGLPARVLTICRYAKINTLGELIEKPICFWIRSRGMGRKYTQMLYDALVENYGISLPGAYRYGIVTAKNDRSVQMVPDIPGRIKTVCRYRGIITVDQLAETSRKQWVLERNIGPKSVYDAENALKRFGLSFSE